MAAIIGTTGNDLLFGPVLGDTIQGFGGGDHVHVTSAGSGGGAITLSAADFLFA